MHDFHENKQKIRNISLCTFKPTSSSSSVDLAVLGRLNGKDALGDVLPGEAGLGSGGLPTSLYNTS